MAVCFQCWAVVGICGLSRFDAIRKPCKQKKYSCNCYLQAFVEKLLLLSAYSINLPHSNFCTTLRFALALDEQGMETPQRLCQIECPLPRIDCVSSGIYAHVATCSINVLICISQSLANRARRGFSRLSL